jgi:hypothetical protein
LRARVGVDIGPLAIGPYRRLWASTIVTSVGGQLTVVAIPLQIYQVTGSSAYVGLAGGFGLVPLVVFGLWAARSPTPSTADAWRWSPTAASR